MKKLSLNFVIAACIFSSFSATANTITCPPTINCIGQQCSANPAADAAFSEIVLTATPIPDGIYYFSEAWSSITNNVQCAYRNTKGNTWALYKTSTRLMPQNGLDSWINVGNSGNYYCSPNPAKPYLANSSECAFTSN